MNSASSLSLVASSSAFVTPAPADAGAGGAEAEDRDVSVTRPASLILETIDSFSGLVVEGSRDRSAIRSWINGAVADSGAVRRYPDDSDLPFFCDWITVSQDHFDVVHEDASGLPLLGSTPLPLIEAGSVWSFDETGDLEFKTTKARKHEGSHDTMVLVKCDGHRVMFSGNVSRFGRTDNVWGFNLSECMRKINVILAHYGLPAFSAGTRFANRGKNAQSGWTGARFSRLDVTCNLETGSPETAHHFLQWMGTQATARRQPSVYGDGETVYFGKGSKRQSWKFYDKAKEMKRHKCTDLALYQYCHDHGLVRFEGTLRSNALTEMGCAYLGDYLDGFAMGQLVHLFDKQLSVVERACYQTRDMDALPSRLQGLAALYLDGVDVWGKMGQPGFSRATLYRLRSALTPYGLDITQRNLKPFVPRTVVIQLQRSEVPSWYQLAA